MSPLQKGINETCQVPYRYGNKSLLVVSNDWHENKTHISNTLKLQVQTYCAIKRRIYVLRVRALISREYNFGYRDKFTRHNSRLAWMTNQIIIKYTNISELHKVFQFKLWLNWIKRRQIPSESLDEILRYCVLTISKNMKDCGPIIYSVGVRQTGKVHLPKEAQIELIS